MVGCFINDMLKYILQSIMSRGTLYYVKGKGKIQLVILDIAYW